MQDYSIHQRVSPITFPTLILVNESINFIWQTFRFSCLLPRCLQQLWLGQEEVRGSESNPGLMWVATWLTRVLAGISNLELRLQPRISYFKTILEVNAYREKMPESSLRMPGWVSESSFLHIMGGLSHWVPATQVGGLNWIPDSALAYQHLASELVDKISFSLSHTNNNNLKNPRQKANTHPTSWNKTLHMKQWN